MNLIHISQIECKLCYSCIRVCPSKAIKVQDGYAEIIQNRCIGCGSCFSVCSQNAVKYLDAKEEVKHLLDSPVKVAAIVAPSISGEFSDITDYRSFVNMIKSLGFDYVNEVSFGVDLMAFQYEKLFKDFNGKYFITANCPPVVSYIEKYYPELVDNIAPIIPHMVTTAKVLHEIHGNDLRVVYISPCIAAKNEVKRFPDPDTRIDAVLTYIELRELFKEFGITETSVAFSDFDQPLGRKGSLFPISRGMLQAVDINEDILTGRIICTEGRENFLQVIKEFKQNIQIKQHIDLFYCDGCIMGPGTSKKGEKFLRRTMVINYVEKRLRSFDKPQWEKDIKKFSLLNFKRTYSKTDDQRMPSPSKAELKDVLRELGRDKAHEILSCGACGHDNCSKFAVAICKGLATLEMCPTYSYKKMNDYIDEMATINNILSETKEALTKSEQKAREEEQFAKELSQTVTSMLQKIPLAIVIVNKDLKIMQSNDSFVKLMGSEAQDINRVVPGLINADLRTLVPFHKLFASLIFTGEESLSRDEEYNNKVFNLSVFTIKKHQIVGGIIRDMENPEVRKDEVVERAREVIRDNLETVQRIAYLLGESSSKTEKILHSIIKSYNTDENSYK
ncbi:MAG: [Fe-Fe] hydrogenase large subunit C-terminal domain-containing protein [Bacteroidota bacterium]